MPNPVEQRRTIEGRIDMPSVPASRVHVDIAARSDRGKVRESNEDAYLVYRLGRYVECVTSSIADAGSLRHEDVGYVMLVADGMGGHEGGEVASRNALLKSIELVIRAPKWALKLDDPATRDAEIQELIDRARHYLAGIHAALREQAAGDPGLAGMGTTLTGAFSVGADLFVSHVGDSKVYLIHDGVMQRVTHDHTVAQQYADLGIIRQEDVARHRMHHVLTRAVGGPGDALEPDLHFRTIADGDRLLLCSDGLTDMVSEPEIAAVLGAHLTSEEACRALVALALDHGGRDNVTVIIAGYRVHETP